LVTRYKLYRQLYLGLVTRYTHTALNVIWFVYVIYSRDHFLCQ
jgi:hypothetical protein